MSSDIWNVNNVSEQLSILYFNARSILLKLDNLAAICDSLDPDIVCIVESWLGGDVCDEEVTLTDPLLDWTGTAMGVAF